MALIKQRIFIHSVIFQLILMLLYPSTSCAMSARGHMIESARSLTNVIIAPLKGIFYAGPLRIRDAYQYEVYGREKEEKRGLLRYKLFAMWRAPGEEMKATIDGVVESVESLGSVTKNLLSIFFSD
jgi:hypothetical protein